MFGWDMMLVAMGLYPEKIGRVTNRYARWIQQYFDALAETDMAVVNIHDDIVKTGVHVFVMEPTTDMAYIAEKYGKTHVLTGNADTRILLSGTKA